MNSLIHPQSTRAQMLGKDRMLCQIHLEGGYEWHDFADDAHDIFVVAEQVAELLEDLCQRESELMRVVDLRF